ncbi:MAG: hypothetical protein ACFFG0_05305 [Candidatus Thorarchaeota archaeon]
MIKKQAKLYDDIKAGDLVLIEDDISTYIGYVNYIDIEKDKIKGDFYYTYHNTIKLDLYESLSEYDIYKLTKENIKIEITKYTSDIGTSYFANLDGNYYNHIKKYSMIRNTLVESGDTIINMRNKIWDLILKIAKGERVWEIYLESS